jgi:hypothetical protein
MQLSAAAAAATQPAELTTDDLATRLICPSCHAKRLTLWTLWLEETLLAPVPHRQVVLTIPKRLRPACTAARSWATWRAWRRGR